MIQLISVKSCSEVKERLHEFKAFLDKKKYLVIRGAFDHEVVSASVKRR
jgi:hypothetical protein